MLEEEWKRYPTLDEARADAHALSRHERVAHIAIVQDDEPPGMGIVFDLDDAQKEHLQSVIKELEDALLKNELPEPVIE